MESLEKRELLTDVFVRNGAIDPVPTSADDRYLFETGWGQVDVNPKAFKDTAAESGGSDTFDFSQVGSSLEVTVQRNKITASTDASNLVVVEGKYLPRALELTDRDDLVTVQKFKTPLDVIEAGAGTDILSYSGASAYSGEVSVHLPTQTATGIGRIEGFEYIVGGRRSDTLVGYANANNKLAGGAGKDEIAGGQSHDVLIGGGGKAPDFLQKLRSVTATPSEGDVLSLIQTDVGLFSSDDDILHGHGGNDALIGGPGNDQLYGGVGDDRLFGNTGKNVFHFEGNWGKDKVVASHWDDTFDFSDATAALDITLRRSGYAVTANALQNEGRWNESRRIARRGSSGRQVDRHCG